MTDCKKDESQLANCISCVGMCAKFHRLFFNGLCIVLCFECGDKLIKTIQNNTKSVNRFEWGIK